ncbi:cbb3-type cytochrome c oxidase N-terminal domain-containing protein [uncultured Winogradskyella sp.]|uniref:cbb3-type cytochrome c oxidase N-terminal domain-containing protein n=1 Tax=uncultured Winogradskyella sp. TaxID=395353 RepID=UPI0026080D9E|nr:cbb3-type cytochrome c oxidase N-terminal domain-containing protein [uncultured Winogradskyella sp.]
MRHLIPSYIRVPVIFFTIAGLVEYFVESGDKPAFIEQPIILLFLLLVLLVLIGIEGIVGSLDNILFQSLDEKSKERYLASRTKSPQFTKAKAIYSKLLGKQKPIEEEGEIILDHNYDGIKELDNNLPPWWVYSFYISIVFAVIYMVRYHVFNADDQFVEYEIEYAEANAAIEEYKRTAKGLVDFNTVELLTETSDLNAGKKIFETNCVACHKADGGGSIGPNLTDKHWILGGGIKNVFKTVSQGGRDGKGMISWKKEGLSPLEIAQVASYVLQFQGTTPAEPKAAEGDIWVDENAESPENMDTESTEESAEDSAEETTDTAETVVSNN